jgi:hypothetical protein
MINKFKSKKVIAGILIFLILIFSEYFFFRNIIGTNNLMGAGDTKLATLIAEHWYNFLRGQEKFGELSMFYPAKNVLGYTDMFLFFGLIHSCFRFVGIDMFIAYKYTALFVHLLGTIFMFFLLYKKLKLKITWGLFGTIGFSFSTALAVNMGHTQLVAISMLPILLIFIIKFFENLKNKKRIKYAFFSMTWYMLLLYNSWYIAFFTILFFLSFSIVYLIGELIQKRNPFMQIYNFIKHIWIESVAYILYISILSIPFFRVYIPASHRYYEYNTYDIPDILSLVIIDERNWLLGNFIKAMKLTNKANMGLSIVLLLTFIVFSIIFIFKKEKKMYNNILYYIIITVIFSIVYTMKITSKEFSLWYFIYKLVPGANAIRVVSRYFLYLSFPIAIITSIIGNILFEKKKFKSSYIKGIILSFLLILLWISNITNKGIYSEWNSTEAKSFLFSVSEPPKKCESFYIIADERQNLDPPEYNLHAFEIANNYKIKTINGYSGNHPDNWEGVMSPLNKEYEISVYVWATLNKLKNVCKYDMKDNEWSLVQTNKFLKFQAYNDKLFNEGNKIKVFTGGLIFGPYIKLPAGKYKVKFVNEITEDSIGEFRIASDEGTKEIAKTISRENEVLIEFELSKETKNIEFTVFNGSPNFFLVKDIELYKM